MKNLCMQLPICCLVNIAVGFIQVIFGEFVLNHEVNIFTCGYDKNNMIGLIKYNLKLSEKIIFQIST